MQPLSPGSAVAKFDESRAKSDINYTPCSRVGFGRSPPGRSGPSHVSRTVCATIWAPSTLFALHPFYAPTALPAHSRPLSLSLSFRTTASLLLLPASSSRPSRVQRVLQFRTQTPGGCRSTLVPAEELGVLDANDCTRARTGSYRSGLSDRSTAWETTLIWTEGLFTARFCFKKCWTTRSYITGPVNLCKPAAVQRPHDSAVIFFPSSIGLGVHTQLGVTNWNDFQILRPRFSIDGDGNFFLLFPLQATARTSNACEEACASGSPGPISSIFQHKK